MLRFLALMLMPLFVFVSSAYVVEKFRVGKPTPRIVTPSSRTIRITITPATDNNDIEMSGKVFDVTGREVDRMQIDNSRSFWTTGDNILLWTPSDGLPTGVYIYQIEGKGQTYNGTVVVAR